MHGIIEVCLFTTDQINDTFTTLVLTDVFFRDIHHKLNKWILHKYDKQII